MPSATPRDCGCRGCREIGGDWVELWQCLSCGWVACSDTSAHQHARAHYEETDHPRAVPMQAVRPLWCYVHGACCPVGTHPSLITD